MGVAVLFSSYLFVAEERGNLPFEFKTKGDHEVFQRYLESLRDNAEQSEEVVVGSWKALFEKYRGIVMSYEGNDFIYPDEWTPEEKAMLIEMKLWPIPEDYGDPGETVDGYGQ